MLWDGDGSGTGVTPWGPTVPPERVGDAMAHTVGHRQDTPQFSARLQHQHQRPLSRARHQHAAAQASRLWQLHGPPVTDCYVRSMWRPYPRAPVHVLRTAVPHTLCGCGCYE